MTVNRVPFIIKTRIRRFLQDRKMKAVIKRMLRLPPDQLPKREEIESLATAWGEDGFRAAGGFLEEVAHRAITTKGPILEIGSGLTTILLGILAIRRGVEVWTLEHSKEYFDQTSEYLHRLGIPKGNFVLAPLTDHGDFEWYAPPDQETMPRNFRLIIADGPPGNTKGGRYGLLPVMRSHIDHDGVILLDDAERPKEQTCLADWSSTFDIEHEILTRDSKSWAVCRFRPSTEAG